MAVRGDEVAASIEAHVRQAIDRLVTEIRTSIDDVRQAVDQQLDAALQSVQADVNALSFRTHVDQSLREFEESLAPAAPAEPAGPRFDSGALKRSLQNIESGKTQVDILNALLDECHRVGSRAALLILKGDTFVGWKGAGFSAHGTADEQIKRFSATAASVPELDRVLREESVVTGAAVSLASRLGVSRPAEAVLVPMVIKDKVAAALYVDTVAGDERQLDANAIQILVFTTGLLIDTLAMRKKVPSPSLSREPDPAPAAAARPAAPRVAPAAPQPVPAPAAPPPAPPRPAPVAPPPPMPDRAGATVAIPAFGFAGGVPEPAAPPAPAPPAAWSAADAAGDVTRLVAPPELRAPVAPAGAPSISEIGERTTTQYVPPAGMNRGGIFGAAGQSEEGKKHDEARRFARLLVSEIKLYNEAKVEQGRRNRDLYERLKEDIDRSRQMYDERISEDVRKASNYFYDELVRILADGDADALGL